MRAMAAFMALALVGALLAAEAAPLRERPRGEACAADGQNVEEPDQELAEAEQLQVTLLQTGLLHLGRRQTSTSREAEEAPGPNETQNAKSVPFLKLPPCKQSYWLRHLAEQSASWCDPRQVPSEQRAPPKLQGLFWLNGLPLPDVAACFSRGVWNKEQRTLRVNVWSEFVFRDNHMADLFESQIFKADMHYMVRFQDDNLTSATLHPEGSGLFNLGMKVFDVVSDFPMIEDEGLKVPGDKWHRPSYFGVGSIKGKVNDYKMWRILDGDLKVVRQNEQAMVKALDSHRKGLHLSRYSADCLSSKACDRNTGATCNVFHCPGWRGKVECVNSGFMWRCLCSQGYCAVNGRCVLVKPNSFGQAASLAQLP